MQMAITPAAADGAAPAVALTMPPIVTTNTAVTNPNSFPVNVTLAGGSGVSVIKVGGVQAGTAVGTYRSQAAARFPSPSPRPRRP
jgi:hypothetical protein